MLDQEVYGFGTWHYVWWVQMYSTAWVTVGGQQGIRGNPSEESNCPEGRRIGSVDTATQWAGR